MEWLRVPKKIYFKKGSTPVALKELRDVYHLNRAFIISEPELWKTGAIAPVATWLRECGLRTAEFFGIEEVPTFENIESGMNKLEEFAPDLIIGVGGAGVMSAAKAMLLRYENPQMTLADMAENYRALDSSRVFPFMGEKAKLVLLSTDGQGNECAAYALLADDEGNKQVIAGYDLLPEIAIVDSDFSEKYLLENFDITKNIVLKKAVRAYTSEHASDYTEGFAIRAMENLLKYIKDMKKAGNDAMNAIIHLTDAGSLAEIAYSNAVLKPETDINDDLANLNDEQKTVIMKIAKAAGIED